MAPLVAPNVCRFIVNGSYAGRPAVNILDMQIDTTASVLSRSEACEAQAGIILNEWTDSILTLVTDEYTALDVSWIDLNSLSGSTGTRTESGGNVWPMPGEGEGASASGAMAIRVNKDTVAIRGQRQGRMYLVGMPEEATEPANPNILTAGFRAVAQPVLTAFLGDINQSDSDPDAYTSQLVVVHTEDNVFTTWSEVTALTIAERVGTQVRRLRG